MLVKEELYDKVADVRRVNDSDVSCHSFCRSGESCLGICSTKRKIDEGKTKFL